jgi:hypothetical protein
MMTEIKASISSEELTLPVEGTIGTWKPFLSIVPYSFPSKFSVSKVLLSPHPLVCRIAFRLSRDRKEKCCAYDKMAAGAATDGFRLKIDKEERRAITCPWSLANLYLQQCRECYMSFLNRSDGIFSDTRARTTPPSKTSVGRRWGHLQHKEGACSARSQDSPYLRVVRPPEYRSGHKRCHCWHH